jgi:hypothetical protein
MNTKYIKSGTYVDIAVTTDRSGRTSVVVTETVHSSVLVDVELPAKSGEFKDLFNPTVKVSKEVEVEKQA